MISFDKLFGKANFAEVISIIKEDDFAGVTNVENEIVKGNHLVVAFDYKGYRCKAEYTVDRNGRVSYQENSFVAIKQSEVFVEHERKMKMKNEEIEMYKKLLNKKVLLLV